MEIETPRIKLGIIGHGSNKFTPKTEATARKIIATILLQHYPNSILVSGHSPVGGIDIWAEEVAKDLEIPMEIKSPRQHSWDGKYGYKARNIDIARTSDEVNVILVSNYPPGYKGQRFETCYHCAKHPEMKSPHVKSGGCWTGWQAKAIGKPLIFHIIKQ